MGLRLKGKVAIVTGGGDGIGRGIATLFAAEGAKVVVASRTPQKGQETVAAIRQADGDAIFVPTDVTQAPDVENMVRQTVAHFGRLGVLCNNAGTNVLRTVVEAAEEDYYRVLDTNLKSVFLCCKYAIPEMLQAGAGSIVNIASMAGLMAFRRDAPYCASKGGLIMLTKQMALDFAAQGIRVNSICPAFIATPLVEEWFAAQPEPQEARRKVERAHPLGRVGTPQDVAYGALYLASDEAGWVTGANLVIDGGMTVGDPTERV